MRKQIQTEITLHAPIDRVWAILSDFSSYPDWSRMIKSFSDQPQVGKRTKVRLEQPGGMSITMNPIFLKLEENREIRWKGRLGIDGLFDGEHYFLLHQVDEQTTLLQHGEIFTGLLVRFFAKMIDSNTKEGFLVFNKALKEKVEGVNERKKVHPEA